MTSRANQITRTSKPRVVYRSLAPDLALLPLTGELRTLLNEDAVKQAIKNLIFTYPGERFYHPDIGSTVARSVFEFIDEFTIDRIKDTVMHTLQAYEPRAQNPSITVEPQPVNNLLYVNVFFTIGTVPGQTFQTTVELRVR